MMPSSVLRTASGASSWSAPVRSSSSGCITRSPTQRSGASFSTWPRRSPNRTRLRPEGAALPPERIGGAARVGTGFEHPAAAIGVDRADGAGGPDPLGPALDLGPAARQLDDDRLGDAAFDGEPARVI